MAKQEEKLLTEEGVPQKHLAQRRTLIKPHKHAADDGGPGADDEKTKMKKKKKQEEEEQEKLASKKIDLNTMSREEIKAVLKERKRKERKNEWLRNKERM